MATRNETKKIYDQIFETQTYNEKAIFYDVMASLCVGKTIDIGCGDSGGVLSRVNDSIGYDLSQTAAKRLAQRGLPCIVGDALNLAVKDGSFETVVSLGALEHFPDKKRALEEMHRILVPGGRLILTVDAGRPPQFRAVGALRRVHSRAKKEPQLLEQPVDEPISKGQLIDMLWRCNFRIVFHGEYSVRSLNLGDSLPARLLKWAIPLRWRTASYVWVILALKDVVGQEDNYGPYHPIRGHWIIRGQP